MGLEQFPSFEKNLALKLFQLGEIKKYKGKAERLKYTNLLLTEKSTFALRPQQEVNDKRKQSEH